MVAGIIARGFFYWLRAPRNNADIRTDEWILAIIRFLLSACFLIAIIRPGGVNEPKVYQAVALSYLDYSLLIILLLLFRSRMSPFVQIGIHLADIIWAAYLICLIQWPTMSFVLFLFVMVSAAFRWGFWEAHLTFATFLFLLITETYTQYPALFHYWQSKSLRELLPEAVLCVGISCMVAILAEAKAFRSESQAIARIVAGARIESGLEQALGILCTEGRRLFGATQVLVVLQEWNRNRASIYQVIRSQDVLESGELDAKQQANYLFPPPGTGVRLAMGRPASHSPMRCHVFEAGKIKKSKTNCGMAEAFVAAHPFRLLLATAIEIEDNRAVRVYVIDPSRYLGGTAGLRFLDRSVKQLAPVFHDMFLVARLETKAKAAAGSHVARELHDGVIQSLSSINLQIEELRRQAGPLFAQRDSLVHIQQCILEEIVALRDFTQQLRSIEIDSSRLLSFLAGMAVKFQVEHGIKARFVSEVDEVRLPPHVCTELAHIVQEALANVRKHSEAKEALIRLSQSNGNWVLSIMDNGRGFGFLGRRTHEELQASGEGPLILMERAAAIGGKVCIESFEGSGSCLELTFPLKN